MSPTVDRVQVNSLSLEVQ
uniref:Uncharacterized protein n=1 Tax=Oryza barthii TaxID=65489 RepID=A0A0D3ENP5_9ORYZ